VRIRPGDVVVGEERPDGSLRPKFKDVYLRHKVVEKRPYRGYYATNKSGLRAMTRPPKGTSVPGKGHPWRKMGWLFNNPLKQPESSQ